MISFKERERFRNFDPTIGQSDEAEHVIYDCSLDKNYTLEDFLDEIKKRTNDTEWIEMPNIDIIMNGRRVPLCDWDPARGEWEFFNNYEWYEEIKNSIIQSVNPIETVNVWMYIEINLVEVLDG